LQVKMDPTLNAPQAHNTFKTMSANLIYYSKDKQKMMREVRNRAEYLSLRNSDWQKKNVMAIRGGDESMKSRLMQMNYSCLPNDDGTLRGSTRMSASVGMDIDHIPAEEMQAVKERILSKKEELGLLMLELSARAAGYHLVFKRKPNLTQEENLKWASDLIGVKYDEGAKDITRVFYTTTASNEDLIYLDDALFVAEPSTDTAQQTLHKSMNTIQAHAELPQNPEQPSPQALAAFDLCVEHAGLKTGEMDVWGEHNWHTNLMAVLSVGVAKLMNRQQLQAVVAQRLPNYSQTEDCQKLIAYFYEKYDADKGFMNASLREINAKVQESMEGRGQQEEAADDEELTTVNSQLSIKKLPQGIRESVEAVGPQLAMPVITAICPAIGALATGVELDVHGQKKGLNLIAYIAGDFASGKGQIDPVVNAWMGEVKTLDKMYLMQEDEWRAKKRAAKNKKEQPEEPKLPVRCLTLNNTVANLAERLANTGGKHAFSFTPEADTVAQKWRSTIGDFSIMLRQSYDGTNYEREARSAEAVNVHIEKLLWNVTMCGTPDALYRVVNNYTDGFQSRIAVARTPDNTFAPLEDKPYVLTDVQSDRIQQIAHLLPLMQGEAVLPKLEARGREWLERIRIETMKNDDAVTARQRFRVCVTAQRMTCCLMLCKVCETLIQKHGLTGAEAQLKQFPNLWKEMLLKTQTPQMLENYDIIADALMENALHFFRDRIENAFCSRDYAGCLNGARTKHGKNDTIFARLDFQFTFEQAMQQSVAIKGADITRNSVQQMLKNWSKQGLVVQTDGLQYRKC